jgi:hypothetical protein
MDGTFSGEQVVLQQTNRLHFIRIEIWEISNSVNSWVHTLKHSWGLETRE